MWSITIGGHDVESAYARVLYTYIYLRVRTQGQFQLPPFDLQVSENPNESIDTDWIIVLGVVRRVIVRLENLCSSYNHIYTENICFRRLTHGLPFIREATPKKRTLSVAIHIIYTHTSAAILEPYADCNLRPKVSFL